MPGAPNIDESLQAVKAPAEKQRRPRSLLPQPTAAGRPRERSEIERTPLSFRLSLRDLDRRRAGRESGRLRRGGRGLLDWRGAGARPGLGRGVGWATQQTRQIEADAARTHAGGAAAADRAADLGLDDDGRPAAAGRAALQNGGPGDECEHGERCRQDSRSVRIVSLRPLRVSLRSGHSLRIFSRPPLTPLVALRVSKTRCERRTTRS